MRVTPAALLNNHLITLERTGQPFLPAVGNRDAPLNTFYDPANHARVENGHPPSGAVHACKCHKDSNACIVGANGQPGFGTSGKYSTARPGNGTAL